MPRSRSRSSRPARSVPRARSARLIRSTTSVSVPSEAFRTGSAVALPASGSPNAAARSAARSGSGGEFRTSRTTHDEAGIRSTSSASRPARSAANSTMCRAASAGYCASPCLTSVCQPEHQRCIGAVAVRTRVTRSRARASSSAARSSSWARSRSSLESSRVPTPPRRPFLEHVGERLPPAPASLEGDGRAEQVRGQPLGERPQQRPDQPVVPGWARRRLRVPDSRVVGVRPSPRVLERRRPRLVQPRVDDDLHAGSLTTPIAP